METLIVSYPIVFLCLPISSVPQSGFWHLDIPSEIGNSTLTLFEQMSGGQRAHLVVIAADGRVELVRYGHSPYNDRFVHGGDLVQSCVLFS